MELSVPARLVHLSISSTSSRRLLVKPKTNLSRKLLPIATQYCSSTRRMNSLTTPRASLNPDGDSKHNNGSASTSSAVDSGQTPAFDSDFIFLTSIYWFLLFWTIALCLISGRIGEVKRVTKETNVSVKINVDGSGVADSSTCIPFLDHMLDVFYFLFIIIFFICNKMFIKFASVLIFLFLVLFVFSNWLRTGYLMCTWGQPETFTLMIIIPMKTLGLPLAR